MARRVLLALVVLALLPASADAATGAISGRVTDKQTGAPVPDACVVATLPGQTSAFPFHNARTAADGTYRIEGLDSADYRVLFDPWRFSPGGGIAGGECYSRSNWFQAPYSSTVQVTDGIETSAIDGQLDRAASISGRITDPTGAPVTTLCLGVVGGPLVGDGVPLQTGLDGRYTISQLQPGSYTLSAVASPSLRTSYPGCNYGYQGRALASVQVSAGQWATGIDGVAVPVPTALPASKTTVTARRLADRNGRVRFQVSGGVARSGSGDCRRGSVTISTRKRSSRGGVVSTRTVGLGATGCAYKLTVAVPRSKLRGWDGKLVVSARFRGTATLLPSDSPARQVPRR